MDTLSPEGARRRAYRIVVAQIVVTLGCTAVFWFLGSGRAAWSALAGGGVSVATTGLSVLIAFSRRAAADSRRATRAFYRAEFGKLAGAVILFALIIQRWNPAPLPMVGTFMATLLLVYPAALLVL